MSRAAPTPLSTATPSVDTTVRMGIRLVEDRLFEWTKSPVGFLDEGSRRLIAAGGKRFRPTLCLLSYLANGGVPFSEDVLDVAAIIELIHTATLVHDDILDDADTRRGQPSAHRLYGVSRAILLGDHFFASVHRRLPNLPQPVQASIGHAAFLLAEGEATELELTRAGVATLEEYFQVIGKKTAVLVEAAAGTGARTARPDGAGVDAFEEFGFHAGVAFQLVDDLLDVEGVTEITGKPAKWDLSRGVPNAAVLTTLEADLRGKPAPVRLPHGIQAELDELVHRMSEVGGDERVRRLARAYSARALDALRSRPATPARDILIEQVEAGVTRLK